MIPKDEVLKAAQPYQWMLSSIPSKRVEGWTFNTEAELLAFANATAERAGGKQDAEILTGDPSEFFRSRDAADAVRAKWLNNGAAAGISYVATLKLDDETRVVSGVIPDDKE